MRKNYLKILFTYKSSMFQGRISRKEYWMSVLCYYVLNSLLYLAFYQTVPKPGTPILPIPLNENLIAIIYLIFVFITFIPYNALAVRRLHDLNLSGWLQILFYVPFCGLVFMFLYLHKGNPNKNQYGDPPNSIQKEISGII